VAEAVITDLMTAFLLVLFGLQCTALVAWGVLAKGRLYTFPFLAGGTFAGFVLPQLIGLFSDKTLPEGALPKTILMCILCQGMCYAGWACCRRPMRILNWPFSRVRLVAAGAAYVVIGAYFFVVISRLPKELTSNSNWTGLPVMYLFFAGVLSYGFAIALVLFARERARPALLISLFGSLFYLDRILLAARRGAAIELGLVVLCALWFGRRVAVPRWTMPVAVLLGSLLMFSANDYRQILVGDRVYRTILRDEGPATKWEEFADVPFLQNLLIVLTEGGFELRNTVYRMEAADRMVHFDWGLFHWNRVVFNFVPAQLVGRELKDALTVPLGNDAHNVLGYDVPLGSTDTGITDCFLSFWYFGCLKFFVIAYVLRAIYRAAEAGAFAAQVLYTLLITSALHTVTHDTQWFFSHAIHVAIFVTPGLLLARRETGGGR
jgi:hypothetical protein